MVQAEAIATLECKLASKFAAALLANAIPCRTISVGTTPSNLYPSNLYTSPPLPSNLYTNPRARVHKARTRRVRRRVGGCECRWPRHQRLAIPTPAVTAVCWPHIHIQLSAEVHIRNPYKEGACLVGRGPYP